MTMKLRDYQELSISMLYEWIANNSGHPVINLPTGSGKSVVIATLCERAVKQWPETRILMLVSSKELVQQNINKLRSIWKGAPLGIYAASLNKRELNEPITYANIGSIKNKASLIGHIDLCIVDECDMISHKQEGSYRNLIDDLLVTNPNMRVVGYTASPFRLGHGLITDGTALFDEIIEPTSIEELIARGYLAPLRSKITQQRLSTEGVHRRGGEFIEKELQEAVDKDYINQAVVDEAIDIASDRRHLLFFCSGVKHAEHINEILLSRGISSATLSGSTPSKERDKIISDFTSGKIRALTNCNILSVGFDFPDLDCIVMLRPTMSPRLYMQVAGRGTRLKSHAKDCLFLDFAGVVMQHGPITAIEPPKRKGEITGGEAPVKLCETCHEIVHASAKVCPACGEPFPIIEKEPLKLHNVDIMGIQGMDMLVNNWEWSTHIGRASDKEMLKVTYYGGLSDAPVTEYLCVTHDGYAGQKARSLLAIIASKASGAITDNLQETADNLNAAIAPSEIEYKRDGKFFRVIDRRWNQ